ncbi:hypothetical protein DFJ73DRAFT_813992 [Zopfochytrium polystomum]|nr:hypothetical protein DFJ73DRAFT_813992 [Zopfochytrium polystomum]
MSFTLGVDGGGGLGGGGARPTSVVVEGGGRGDGVAGFGVVGNVSSAADGRVRRLSGAHDRSPPGNRRTFGPQPPQAIAEAAHGSGPYDGASWNAAVVDGPLNIAGRGWDGWCEQRPPHPHQRQLHPRPVPQVSFHHRRVPPPSRSVMSSSTRWPRAEEEGGWKSPYERDVPTASRWPPNLAEAAVHPFDSYSDLHRPYHNHGLPPARSQQIHRFSDSSAHTSSEPHYFLPEGGSLNAPMIVPSSRPRLLFDRQQHPDFANSRFIERQQMSEDGNQSVGASPASSWVAAMKLRSRAATASDSDATRTGSQRESLPSDAHYELFSRSSIVGLAPSPGRGVHDDLHQHSHGMGMPLSVAPPFANKQISPSTHLRRSHHSGPAAYYGPSTASSTPRRHVDYGIAAPRFSPSYWPNSQRTAASTPNLGKFSGRGMDEVASLGAQFQPPVGEQFASTDPDESALLAVARQQGQSRHSDYRPQLPARYHPYGDRRPPSPSVLPATQDLWHAAPKSENSWANATHSEDTEDAPHPSMAFPQPAAFDIGTNFPRRGSVASLCHPSSPWAAEQRLHQAARQHSLELNGGSKEISQSAGTLAENTEYPDKAMIVSGTEPVDPGLDKTDNANSAELNGTASPVGSRNASTVEGGHCRTPQPVEPSTANTPRVATPFEVEPDHLDHSSNENSNNDTKNNEISSNKTNDNLNTNDSTSNNNSNTDTNPMSLMQLAVAFGEGSPLLAVAPKPAGGSTVVAPAAIAIAAPVLAASRTSRSSSSAALLSSSSALSASDLFTNVAPPAGWRKRTRAAVAAAVAATAGLSPSIKGTVSSTSSSSRSLSTPGGATSSDDAGMQKNLFARAAAVGSDLNIANGDDDGGGENESLENTALAAAAAEEDQDPHMDPITLRRKRNAEAARRTRLRKLQTVQHYQELCEKLEQDNLRLAAEMVVVVRTRDRLAAENEALHERLRIMEARLQLEVGGGRGEGESAG